MPLMTKRLPIKRPATPADAKVSVQLGTQLLVNWDDADLEEHGFDIERSTAGGPWSAVIQKAAGTHQHTDAGLTENTAYSYRVRSVTAGNRSKWSDPYNVTPMTYARVLTDTYGADEVWPLVDISSGTAIHAYSNGSRDGTLSGWALQNEDGPVPGSDAPYSDGSSDYGNILTSGGGVGLTDIFDSAKGSIIVWVKLNEDASGAKLILRLETDSNSRIDFRQNNTTPDTLGVYYVAEGTADFVEIDVSALSTWSSLGISWDTAADEVKGYLNGSLIGSIQSGLGTWAGTMDTAVIGAANTTPTNVFDGHLAYMAVKFGSVWSPSDFQGMTDYATFANVTRSGVVISSDKSAPDFSVNEIAVIREGNPQILGSSPVYKAWYRDGYDNVDIRYAESADGISWTKYGSNPLFSDHGRGCVVKRHGTYYMYATDFTVSPPVDVDLYTSTDGITWSLDTAAALSVGAAAEWDDDTLGNTHVWIEETTSGVNWYMVYDAKRSSTGWKVGLATSSDGVTWIKSGSNPVIDDGKTEGCGYVEKVGDTWYMYQHRSTLSTEILPNELYQRNSTNLTTWSDAIPLMFRSGSVEGYDSAAAQIADPWLLNIDGQLYMWYGANDDGNAPGIQISHAIFDTNFGQRIIAPD